MDLFSTNAQDIGENETATWTSFSPFFLWYQMDTHRVSLGNPLTGYHEKKMKMKMKILCGFERGFMGSWKGGSYVVQMQHPPPPLLHCHKKMGTRTPSFTRHDFFFFCPARNYPKRDWELVLRVGLVTGVEPAVGSVLDPGLWEVGLCGGTQWEAPCSAAHDHSESHRTRISTRISRP